MPSKNNMHNVYSYFSSAQQLNLGLKPMTTILSIETSSTYCSVALKHKAKLQQQLEQHGRGQAEIILPMIDSLLQNNGVTVADIDYLGVSCGPASFTGIRLTTSIVQAFSFLYNIPIISLSSLRVQIQTVLQQCRANYFRICNNAHMGEVFIADYEIIDNQAQLCGNEQLCVATQPQPLPERPWVAVGNGWQCSAQMQQQQQQASFVISDSYPQAQAMLPLIESAIKKADTLNASQVSPVYLRKADAWKTLEQQKKR